MHGSLVSALRWTRCPQGGRCRGVRCASAPVHQEVRSFATTTRGLLELSEWLSSHGCTHVAMEATGVYWKPIWRVLEGEFEIVLANAQHVRNVPGRKTDVGDAAWLADLLAHGLVRASFVPPVRIQQLRDVTRTRKQLVREMSQHVLRMQKVLEDANIKLASVLSSIVGQSGRAMLDAIIAGEQDPERLAALAVGTAKKKTQALIEALRGRVTPHPGIPDADSTSIFTRASGWRLILRKGPDGKHVPEWRCGACWVKFASHRNRRVQDDGDCLIRSDGRAPRLPP